MQVPSLALLAASGMQILLGGALGLGIGPIPRLGLQGVAAGMVIAFAGATLFLLWFLYAGRGLVDTCGSGQTRWSAACSSTSSKVGAVSSIGPSF